MTRLHEFLTKLNFRTILSFLSYSSNKIGLYIEYEYVQRNLLHNLFLNATLLRVDKLELWGDEKNERKDDAWKLSSPFGVTPSWSLNKGNLKEPFSTLCIYYSSLHVSLQLPDHPPPLVFFFLFFFLSLSLLFFFFFFKLNTCLKYECKIFVYDNQYPKIHGFIKYQRVT
jgi:hypothetical protein